MFLLEQKYTQTFVSCTCQNISVTISRNYYAIRLTCPGKSVQALYKDTLAALQELLKSVLAKDPTPDGLQSIFKVRPCASD